MEGKCFRSWEGVMSYLQQMEESFGLSSDCKPPALTLLTSPWSLPHLPSLPAEAAVCPPPASGPLFQASMTTPIQTPLSQQAFQHLVNDYYAKKKKHYEPTWNLDHIETEAQSSAEKTESEEHEINTHQGKEFTVDMPHLPSEETASGNLTDLVAKQSKDSNASDHPMHDEENNATSGGSAGKQATEQDHKASPGIVHTADLGEKKGKEELKERATELNK